MVTRRGAALVCLIGVSLLAGASSARGDDEQMIERARTLLDLLISNEFEEFVAAGDETMKAKFSVQQAQQIWAGVGLRLGRYQWEESAHLTHVDDYASVRFVLYFTRGKLTMRIVLDQQGRLSGLWLDHFDTAGPYLPPDYVDQDRFREEKVTVSAGEYPLPGTLAIPKGDGPYAGVVLVHGSGPHDQDELVGRHWPFRDLAWGLASRGVAVLRYEKRTMAHPHARKPGEWTLADETIEDAVAAAELLRKRPEIDAQRVYIAGHSLGGFAAPYIAKRDGKLAGIIILAGNARSILDLLEEQTEYLANLDGTVSPQEQQRLGKFKQLIAAVRAGRLDDVPEGAGLPVRYLAELHRLHPAAVAEELDIPMLIIQGGRDYQVTWADFALWKKHLAARKNVTFKLFDRLNHLLSPGQGASRPAEYQRPGHVDVAVVELIAKWIKAQPTGR